MDNIKRVVFVNTGVPNTYTGGGAFTTYSLTKEMKRVGIEVRAIIIIDKETESSLTNEIEQYKNLVDHLDIIYKREDKKNIIKKISSKFSWRLETVYPEVKYADEINSIVEQARPDIVMAYHFPALAAISKITNIIKAGLVGDPQFAVIKFRFSYWLKKFDLKHIFLLPFFPLLYLKYRKFNVQLLNNCQIKGAFAAHHAKELAKVGVKNCKYYQTPLLDPLEKEKTEENINKKEKFRILLLGHMKGVATVDGLSLLAKEILPILVNKIGKDNFVINIVGGYFDSLPQYIKQALSKVNINVKGYLKLIDKEMLLTDIFLVPTPIKLGIRVRIVTAMGYGALVATHEANRCGIPELKDKFNCLIASSGEELANRIVDCYEKKYDTATIRKNARDTFVKYFKSNKATTNILVDIDRKLDQKQL